MQAGRQATKSERSVNKTTSSKQQLSLVFIARWTQLPGIRLMTDRSFPATGLADKHLHHQTNR